MEARGIISGTLVVAALLISCLAAAPAQALIVRGTPVTVMNTAPDGGSIPVTGSVGISGTANVNVTNTVPVTGTVGISGPVTVSGAVINSENPDRSPYRERALNITIPVNFVNGIASFPTPEGKRYVIQYVAVSCYTPSASDSFRAILSAYKRTSPSSADIFNIPLPPLQGVAAPFGGYLWNGSANLLVYADPGLAGGSGLNINISHMDFSVEAGCNAYVFGHTVDNP
uniref:Lipoprotein n=1 Tax=Geobacter metallireducens TaxID=28232 RepID=A0A831XLY0_GEOME